MKKIPWITGLACLITVAAAVIIFAYWGNQKDVWFCDEAYTYEIANSSGQPNVLAESQNWISGYDVKMYFGAPYRWFNLSGTKDNVPVDNMPLYYLLIRIISVIFVGSASKWLGLLVNLCFLVPFVVLLWGSIYHLCKRKVLASFFTIALAYHPLVLSQMTTIRIYCPFVVFAMFMYILVMCLKPNERNPLWLWAAIWISTVGGLLTHYHFWMFTAMLSGFFCLFLIIKKKWKLFGQYVGCMLLALAGVSAFHPRWLWNLQFGHGEAGVSKIFDFSNIGNEILFMLEQTAYLLSTDTLHWSIVFLLIFLITGIYIWRNRGDRPYSKVMIGLLSAGTTIFLIGHTVQERSPRYFWVPVTLLFFLLIYMLYKDLQFILQKHFEKKFKDLSENGIEKRLKMLPLILCTFLLLADGILEFGNIENIMYLTNRPANTRDVLKENASVPWVVYTDTVANTLNFKLYCSYFDFMIPEKICRVGSLDEPYSDKVIIEADEVILYIDESDMELTDALDYLDACKGKSYEAYEYLAESTYCSVYRIRW